MATYWIQIVIVSFLIYVTNGQNVRQCYTCEGTGCISQLGFNVINCTTATDQCTTIYNEYTPIKRACYSELTTTDKTSCDNTTNVECSKCDTDNCNYLGRVDHTCVSCSSVKNRTCLTSPETYTASRCLAPMYSGSLSCYIKSDGETTQRGCIVTQSELNECTTNSNNCSLCSEPGCNSYEFPKGRRKCYRGTNLDYCDNANDNCFAYNIFGEKQQTCSNDVEQRIWNLCDSNPFRCMECLDDGCNTNVKFNIQCRQCDSSSADKTCAVTPNLSPLVTCTDGCATYLKNETGSLTTTHRSCFENLSTALKTECLSGSKLCQACSEDDCNSIVLQEERLSCYQCKGSECSAANLTSTACPSYSSTDKCLSIVKNGQPVEFTCLSSFNRTVSCANASSCIVSECTENGCNKPDLFEKSTSCLQCDTRTDVECSTAPSTVGYMPCKQPVDICYTMLQGENVLRGCLADLNTTQQTYCRANCELCNSTACNNEIFPPNRLFCHQCDSRVNSSCGETINTEPSMCVKYNTINKCVALLTSNGTYIRACTTDTEASCKDTLACSICDSSGCNSDKIVETPGPEPGTTEPDPGTSDPDPEITESDAQTSAPDPNKGSVMSNVNAIVSVTLLITLMFILNVN